MEEKVTDRWHYHHIIVSLLCEHDKRNEKPKPITWLPSPTEKNIVDSIYWALRNGCALTKFKMDNFTINPSKRSVVYK